MVEHLSTSCQQIDRITIMTQTRNIRSTNIRSTNWLRQLRKNAGIDTVDDFAARLQLEGVSFTRAAVSHWENGRHKPPLHDADFRKALSRVLRVSEAEILRLAGFELEKADRSDAAERAAYLVDQLPAEKQDLAIKLLEQLL